MQADDIRLGQQLLEIGQFRAMLVRRPGIDQRVAGEHAQAETERAAADGLPDAAEADQAEGLAGKTLHAPDFIPAPAVLGLYLAVIREQAGG